MKVQLLISGISRISLQFVRYYVQVFPQLFESILQFNLFDSILLKWDGF
jgi:hypothetical protein